MFIIYSNATNNSNNNSITILTIIMFMFILLVYHCCYYPSTSPPRRGTQRSCSRGPGSSSVGLRCIVVWCFIVYCVSYVFVNAVLCCLLFIMYVCLLCYASLNFLLGRLPLAFTVVRSALPQKKHPNSNIIYIYIYRERERARHV